MTDQEVTLGEVVRSVRRIEDSLTIISGQLQSVMTSCPLHREQIGQLNVHMRHSDGKFDELEKKVSDVFVDPRFLDLDKRVTGVQVRSAYISGVIAAVGLVINYLFKRA